MSETDAAAPRHTEEQIVGRFRFADASTLGRIIKHQKPEWREALAAWRLRYGHEFPVMAIVNEVEVRDTDHLDYASAMECGPKAEKREWACNRCNYTWNGNGGWCPECGHEATHGDAFDPANTQRLLEPDRLRAGDKQHAIVGGGS